jgi:hypothetical protein
MRQRVGDRAWLTTATPPTRKLRREDSIWKMLGLTPNIEMSLKPRALGVKQDKLLVLTACFFVVDVEQCLAGRR